MSKQYQRPVGAYAGHTALSRRDKYQQDASAQPRVAISSAKIDGDFNYILDALNEINSAAGDMQTIAERLNIAMNADGTLKASASLTVDDWITFEPTVTRYAPNILHIAEGDYTASFTKGRKLKLTVNNETLFAYVKSSTFNSGITTVTLNYIRTVLGEPTSVGADPSYVAYSSIRAGQTGNIPSVLTDVVASGGLTVENAAGRQIQFSVDDYGKLILLQNQGSEDDAYWVQIAVFDANGLVLNNGSVAEVNLNASLAQKLNFKLDASHVGTSAHQLVALDDNAKLPAVDGSQLLGVSGMPVGAIAPFVSETAVPSDWLVCDGSTFSATAFPKLNTILGGTTLPDLRGEFIRGADLGRGVDDGRVVGSTQSDVLQGHSHRVGVFSVASEFADNRGVATLDGEIYTSSTDGYIVANYGPTYSNRLYGGTSIEGGTETRPRNVAFVYAVKAK